MLARVNMQQMSTKETHFAVRTFEWRIAGVFLFVSDQISLWGTLRITNALFDLNFPKHKIIIVNTLTVNFAGQ